MHSSLRWIALGTAGLVAALVLSYAMGWLRPAVPRATTVLEQSVYVWQRDWSEAVQGAVRERAPAFDAGVVALGAEIAWKDGALQHVLVPIGHALLADSARTSGIALRIGPCPKDLLRDDATIASILQIARDMLANARAAGWEPAELQLDFDSATSRLDDYRRWVEVIAAEVRPVPVTITVLPTWMSSPAFGPLVAASAGFVLQVHSVDKAAIESDAPSLCDAASAVSWTERAAHFGVPFRVALPTYGYLAMLDDDGKLRGLVAETGSPLLSAGSRARLVSAEPRAMADLVAHLSRNRPSGMQGIIWYRLPVDGDRLNWAWPTLSRVMAGEAPAAELAVRAVPIGEAVVELVVDNSGDLDAAAPAALEVSWPGGATVVGADGLAGMQWRRVHGTDGGDALRFERSTEEPALRVAPRGSRVLGWVRLSSTAEVKVDVIDERLSPSLRTESDRRRPRRPRGHDRSTGAVVRRVLPQRVPHHGRRDRAQGGAVRLQHAGRAACSCAGGHARAARQGQLRLRRQAVR